MHQYPATAWWVCPRTCGQNELKAYLPFGTICDRLDGVKRQGHGKHKGGRYIGVDQILSGFGSCAHKTTERPDRGSTNHC